MMNYTVLKEEKKSPSMEILLSAMTDKDKGAPPGNQGHQGNILAQALRDRMTPEAFKAMLNKLNELA